MARPKNKLKDFKIGDKVTIHSYPEMRKMYHRDFQTFKEVWEAAADLRYHKILGKTLKITRLTDDKYDDVPLTVTYNGDDFDLALWEVVKSSTINLGEVYGELRPSVLLTVSSGYL